MVVLLSLLNFYLLLLVQSDLTVFIRTEVLATILYIKNHLENLNILDKFTYYANLSHNTWTFINLSNFLHL